MADEQTPSLADQMTLLLEHPQWLREGQRQLIAKTQEALAAGVTPNPHAVFFITTWHAHHVARKSGFRSNT